MGSHLWGIVKIAGSFRMRAGSVLFVLQHATTLPENKNTPHQEIHESSGGQNGGERCAKAETVFEIVGGRLEGRLTLNPPAGKRGGSARGERGMQANAAYHPYTFRQTATDV